MRPLTGGDYIVARWVAFFAVMMLAVLGPQLVLFGRLSLGHPTPLVYLRSHWLDLPRTIVSAVVMASYFTSFALLIASFTSRRAYASVFLVGLFAITAPSVPRSTSDRTTSAWSARIRGVSRRR